MGLIKKPAQVEEKFPSNSLPKSLAKRIEKWKMLCSKTEEERDLYVQAHVLTAVFTAIRRGQEQTTTSISSEPQDKSGELPKHYRFSVRACMVAEEVLWSCGYRRTSHPEFWEEDSDCNVIQSSDKCRIKSFTLTVQGLQDESLDSINALYKKWEDVNSRIPAEGKKPAKKRKQNR